MQTIQQERARHALRQVDAAAHDNRIGKSEFKSYASALPAMIHMNGLGQAAAFYRSKSTGGSQKARAYKALYDILSGWLREPGQPYHDLDLLAGITQEDIYKYRLAQAEAMALMDWVKKFADAFIEDGVVEGEQA